MLKHLMTLIAQEHSSIEITVEENRRFWLLGFRSPASKGWLALDKKDYQGGTAYELLNELIHRIMRCERCCNQRAPLPHTCRIDHRRMARRLRRLLGSDVYRKAIARETT